MSNSFEFTADNSMRVVERLLPQGDYRAYRDGAWGTLVLKVPHIVDVEEKWVHGAWHTDTMRWYSLRLPTPPESKPGFFARLFKRNNLPSARVVVK